MDQKKLEEKNTNQEYVIYFYKIGLYNCPILNKEIFYTEKDLKEFIMNSKNYIGIDDIFVDGKRVYFKKDETVELIYC